MEIIKYRPYLQTRDEPIASLMSQLLVMRRFADRKGNENGEE